MRSLATGLGMLSIHSPFPQRAKGARVRKAQGHARNGSRRMAGVPQGGERQLTQVSAKIYPGEGL